MKPPQLTTLVGDAEPTFFWKAMEYALWEAYGEDEDFDTEKRDQEIREALEGSEDPDRAALLASYASWLIRIKAMKVITCWCCARYKQPFCIRDAKCPAHEYCKRAVTELGWGSLDINLYEVARDAVLKYLGGQAYYWLPMFEDPLPLPLKSCNQEEILKFARECLKFHQSNAWTPSSVNWGQLIAIYSTNIQLVEALIDMAHTGAVFAKSLDLMSLRLHHLNIPSFEFTKNLAQILNL